ncbi:SMR-type multidrug efflux transporter [Staphylococcus piscifermentans]|uniref:QacE family quaternary ammonium compound efflux SMR transporter n=2 Tax=Staphylococcus TaxID=1279 RepID=A0A239TQI4_9STAP|nr:MULTISPECIES: SMR family transporter [Staphylococcus]AYU55922.1 QacE family quaternary ammonium compound efflux SMR transporter [Staphylococcus debuckii]RTX82518.1 QacE family quaternary ammonium compound efflux SMR transporter [Staphylococcus piscifermentans]GEP85135.1 QacE family quaternary ammonium compound efflux SMR transporter [Staphylococcus piscifermentans]SNU99966.1 SMR-type multidrug efflux transporter [Staphylococcus piscifermentans]
MRWVKVILAGIVEIIWVNCIKNADSILSWGVTLIMIALSFALVISACKTLPVGTAYAIFVGIGTVGTVILDMAVYGDPFSFTKLFLLILLLIGILGLKLSTDNEESEGTS